MNSKRFKFQMSQPEQLEARRVMTATPLDLDLSTVETQSVFVGDSLDFNLFDVGGTLGEESEERNLMIQLDPDSDETPAGASISFDGNFSWTPTADQAGLHRISVIAVDQGEPQQADVEELFIQVQLGRPEVDLNGTDTEGSDFANVFHVGRDPVNVVDEDVDLSDMNDETLQGATITLTNQLDGEAETLTVDTTETAISAEFIENQLILSGEDTLENYEKVLATLNYNNSNESADPTTRIIEISVTDGEYDSEIATSMIAVNYAPDLAPIDDVSVKAGELLEVELTATDINEDQTLAFLLDVESADYVSLTQEAGSRTATLALSPAVDMPAEEVEVRVMVLDQYGLADSQSFIVSIEENLPPIISELEDQTITQDSETAELPFSVEDAESAPESLLLEASSDNPELIPIENIVLSGEGTERSVKAIPMPGMTGEANLMVTVSDGVSSSNETFKVTVEAANLAPVAADDAYQTTADTRLSISPIGVLTNDTDPQGEPLSVIALDGDTAAIGSPVSLSSGAELTLNSDGSFSYDPTGKFDSMPEGESITESFAYTVANSNGETASANFEILVDGVNDAPVAENDAFSTDANTALTISATGVLNNDSDIDENDTLQVASIGGLPEMVGTEMELASGALLTVNSDGSLTYDPNGKFADLEGDQLATDLFSYEVADASGVVATADVEITVTAPSNGQDQNAPPINSVPGRQEVNLGETLVFSDASGNGISVSDPDAGDAIVETSIMVESGSLTLSDGFSNTRHKLVGTISQINNLLEGMVYTPVADVTGEIALTIISNDLGNQGSGGAKSDSDTVLIAVNQAPTEPISETDTLDQLVDSILEDALAADQLVEDAIFEV